MEPQSVPVTGGSKRERFWVGFSIAAAALLFLLSASLLFYRYTTVHEPTSGIHVLGNAALDGAIVSVQARSTPSPLEARLTRRWNYALRFVLDPGTYELSVTTPDGEVVHSEELELYSGRAETIDLSKLKPDTRPS